MSSSWHWFIIVGTLLSLGAILWLLFSNRTVSGKETTGHQWDGIEELDNPMPMWWVGMFVATIAFTLIYLAYYPGLGNFAGAGEWTSTAQHDAEVARHDERFAPLYAELAAQDSDALIADRRAMQVGRRLFINNCATCHGVNGTGAFGFPDLTDAEWIWGGSEAAIKQSIASGRMAAMPGWGPALGDEGLHNVTQHVLKLAGQPHDAAAAAAGEGQYTAICVACHGNDGTGNAALGAPDLTNDLWLYGGTAEQIAFTIANGRNGNMPAQQDILGDERIHILAAYVRSLSQ